MASLNAQDENIIIFQPDLNQYAQIKQNKKKRVKCKIIYPLRTEK